MIVSNCIFFFILILIYELFLNLNIHIILSLGLISSRQLDVPGYTIEDNEALNNINSKKNVFFLINTSI